MEISFKLSYPADPFFLRVVSPRCVWYTGHVTAGGSVCIESLTHGGTAGSWQARCGVERGTEIWYRNTATFLWSENSGPWPIVCD